MYELNKVKMEEWNEIVWSGSSRSKWALNLLLQSRWSVLCLSCVMISKWSSFHSGIIAQLETVLTQHEQIILDIPPTSDQLTQISFYGFIFLWEGYENNLLQNTDSYDSVMEILFTCISIVAIVFALCVFITPSMSVCHQYSWPAVQIILQLVIIAAGQPGVNPSSTTIICVPVDKQELGMTLSSLCSIVSHLPPPPDSSCDPHSGSRYYTSSFSCGLFRDESEWRMGEERGQLTREQLASTIMAALMSSPGRVWNADAVEGMCVRKPRLAWVMKQFKVAQQS